MAEQTCPRCDRPIHDTAYVCPGCEANLARALRDVARIAGDITLTVAKITKVRRRGGADYEREWYRGDGALYPTPMPVDLDKGARHDAAVGELTTWARHIGEERGPGAEQAEPQRHPLAAITAYLVANLRWLRYRQEAPEAWPAMHDACAALERVVDTAADEVIVGRCPCDHWLYARAGADTVRCWRCGTRYDVASSRDALRADLEDRVMTGAEIARLVGYLGIADSAKARLMIKVWGQRDKLPRHEGEAGETLYRFGDALPLLMVAYARAA